MSEQNNLFLAQQEVLNATTIWILFLFLGWSYGSMGQMGKQIFFYLTLGGVGLWALYRLFTLNGAIRKYNQKVYQKYGITQTV